MFPHEDLTTTRIHIYYKALEDVSIERIEENAWWHIKNRKFFPKPSELRQKDIPLSPSYHDHKPLNFGKLAERFMLPEGGLKLEKAIEVRVRPDGSEGGEGDT